LTVVHFCDRVKDDVDERLRVTLLITNCVVYAEVIVTMRDIAKILGALTRGVSTNMLMLTR
jgi:hypothetical protein